jgi:peptide/nickel transport system substrate-binding protein
MNQAGFQVDLQPMEWGTLSKRMFDEQKQYKSGQIAAPTYDMLLLSWASVTLDADYALYEVFHSGQQYNLAYYKNPQVDAWLEQARASSDQNQRKELYAQTQKQIMEDAPQIFLHYEPQILGMKSDLQGLKVLPFEHYLLHDAHW